MASRSHYNLVQSEDFSDMEMKILSEDSSPLEDPPETDDKPKAFPSHKGLMMAVGSSLMFSLCSVIVKYLTMIPETELAVFRFIGVLFPSLSMVIYRSETPFPKGLRWALMIRCIFGTTSLILRFYAFRNMPLADASVIVFSVPAVVTILARLYLKEPCGRFQSALIVLTLTGVLIICRPPWLFGSLSEGYTWKTWKGAMAALTATFVAAVVYIVLRKLKSVHYSVIMADFGFVGIVISSVLAVTVEEPCVPPCGLARWLVIAIGVLSFGGQYLLTKALQIEQAGPVSIARTSDIVFAFIWQILFFGESPDILSFVGASLVTSSILVLGFRKWLIAMPDQSGFKKKFEFVVK